jgi:hypothetical protein
VNVHLTEASLPELRDLKPPLRSVVYRRAMTLLRAERDRTVWLPPLFTVFGTLTFWFMGAWVATFFNQPDLPDKQMMQQSVQNGLIAIIGSGFGGLWGGFLGFQVLA